MTYPTEPELVTMNVRATRTEVVVGTSVVVLVVVWAPSGQPAGLQQQSRRKFVEKDVHVDVAEKAHRLLLVRKLGSVEPPLTKSAHVGGTGSLSQENAVKRASLLFTARMEAK